MATDDQQRLVTGVASAPATFTVPGNGQIRPKAVFAHFDGTGAAGSFQPALKVTSDAGKLVGIYPTSNTLAAGASADVSWFPEVGGFTPTPGTGIPPAGNLDGYIFKKANVTATGVGHANRNSLLIRGNPVTLDGATSILIEFSCSWVEINTGAVNQAVVAELWDHFGAADVDKGEVGVFEYFGVDTAGAPMTVSTALTPAAGTHTYSFFGWKNVAASTCTFVANTLLDGSGNVAPMWYRIIVIPFDPTLPA